MKERGIIGKGYEHDVFESKIDGWVLKKPNSLSMAFLRLFNRSPIHQTIREEIEFHYERFARANIIFPETRIFPIGKGYVMAQRYVEDDQSLRPPDILQKLQQTGDQYLVDLYLRDSRNFHSNQGNLYCLDVTFGLTRYLHSWGIMDIEKQKHIATVLLRTLSPMRVDEVEEASSTSDIDQS